MTWYHLSLCCPDRSLLSTFPNPEHFICQIIGSRSGTLSHEPNRQVNFYANLINNTLYTGPINQHKCVEKVKDATDAEASSDKYLFDTNISYYIEKVGWVWGENKLADREGQGGGQKINI